MSLLLFICQVRTAGISKPILSCCTWFLKQHFLFYFHFASVVSPFVCFLVFVALVLFDSGCFKLHKGFTGNSLWVYLIVTLNELNEFSPAVTMQSVWFLMQTGH